MKYLLQYKYFLLVTFVVTILIFAADFFSSNALVYGTLIGSATGILSQILADWIASAKDSAPLPKIKTYADHDKSVDEIDRFMKGLVRRNVCDLTTLYLRDEMDPDEFNLISDHGLKYIYPMFGPLVFNDFRKDLDQADPEEYYRDETDNQSGKNKTGEDAEGFRNRELVESRARFVLKDKDGCALAAWHLNWRKRQNFTDKNVKELRRYRDIIFNAVEKVEGISKKRQYFYNSELRARRWIDYNVSTREYEDVDELIFEAIYSYLESYKPSELRIKIGRLQGDAFRYKEKNYKLPYGVPSPQRSDSAKEHSDIIWVAKTTRPMFGPKSAHNKNKAYRIIVPIRLHSNIEKCIGVIVVECNHKPFVPEMVKPLCFLADHFSRIEVPENN